MSGSRIVALYTLIGTILLSWTMVLLIKTSKIPWPHKHQTPPAPPPTAIMPVTRTILLYYLLAISLLTLTFIMLVALARPIALPLLDPHQAERAERLRRFCRETPPVFNERVPRRIESTRVQQRFDPVAAMAPIDEIHEQARVRRLNRWLVYQMQQDQQTRLRAGAPSHAPDGHSG